MRALPERARIGRQGAGELLEVEEFAGGVVVRMMTATGPIDTRLESHDCAVLAGAVAAVADAWFVELPTRPLPEASELSAEPGSSVGPTTSVSPRWSLAVARALVIELEQPAATASTH